MGDTRAVSPAVTQALTIGISTILISGLLLSGGQYIENRQEDTVRTGLQDIGSGVSSDLVRLDQFQTSGLDEDLLFTSAYPSELGGQGYRIEVVDGSPVTITVSSTAEDLSTTVRFESDTDVCDSTIGGGTIVVAYDHDDG
jgi:hypothetical protein